MKLFRVLLMLIAIVFLGSCASQKKVTYLQDIPNGYQQRGEENYEIRIRPDDLISIMVNSKEPELAQMFNLPVVGYQTSSAAAQYRLSGYLVDKDGYINFPILGNIYIGGMTRKEVVDYISYELISNGYLNDPIITIQFLNFKVSVVGEVARPGIIEISSDRITIFDALSAAGDLTIYGNRNNVKVIRIIDGKKTVSEVDLRKANILDSPFYYLQQNDVIYVEPSKARSGQRNINANRSIGTFASIVSVVLSILSLVL